MRTEGVYNTSNVELGVVETALNHGSDLISRTTIRVYYRVVPAAPFAGSMGTRGVFVACRVGVAYISNDHHHRAGNAAGPEQVGLVMMAVELVRGSAAVDDNLVGDYLHVRHREHLDATQPIAHVMFISVAVVSLAPTCEIL